jgi:hypothetical protein
MRYVSLSVLLLLACSVAVVAQAEKGVDVQTEKIRTSGNGAGSGNSHPNGIGNGISWGKDRTATRPLLPNPYRFTGRMNILVKAVQDVMSDRKIIADEATSRPDEGLIIGQPFTFSKGAVISRGELSRYSDLPESNTTTWTGGRVTYTVQVLPVDGMHANVMVSAKIEGKTNDILRTEWLSLSSNGIAEDEFMSDLINKLTGDVPAGIVQP